MNLELRLVLLEEKEILRNLFEKYDYEFSQWDLRDVNQLGLYGYEYLDYYWNEERNFPYFILVDGKLAGFVMVSGHPEAANRPMDFSLAEFFVMYKYREQGVGTYAAKKVFELHKGRWQLKRHPKNLASVAFWNKVVSSYTNGKFQLIEGYPGTEYDDGTLGDLYLFDNTTIG